MKVLFISAPIGSGHIRAARAIGSALQEIDSSNQVEIANVFDFFPSWIGDSILKGYLRILSVFPRAYGIAYGWGNSSGIALYGRRLISRLLARQMLAYINSYEPDVVVCTHATPAGLVADLLRRGELKVPGVAVVTDFVLHRLWIYPEIHHYFVANEDLRQQLAREGIPLEHSCASGIPVDVAFTSLPSRQVATRRLGLDPDLPTVMIMGGGAGVLPMDSIIKTLDRLNISFQMMAVCGNNHTLYTALSGKQDRRHRLLVFGFIENIPALMAASTILVTKPGGMTTAEAICCGLPLLLYSPIPGQEEANAKSLLKDGTALQVNTLEQLANTVSSLLSQNDKLSHLQHNALAAAKPKASAVAADVIWRLASQ